jgi:hypothetical protein
MILFFRPVPFILLILISSHASALWSGKDNRGDTVRVDGFDAGMCRVYVIETNTGLFLVDAGSPGEENRILSRLKKHGEKKTAADIHHPRSFRPLRQRGRAAAPDRRAHCHP